MKVVIVKEIEKMPTDCDSCPFQDHDRNCGILGEYTMLNEWVEDAPYYDLVGKGDCPLKPLPQMKNTSKLQGFGNSQIIWTDRIIHQNEGWNYCLEEIIGDDKDEV